MTQAIGQRKEPAAMLYENLPAIITAITGIIIAFGGGIRWIITRMDRKDEMERKIAADALAEMRQQFNSEREKLQLQFVERIATLEQHIRGQDEEIARMRDQIARYSRHVGVLEGILRSNGIEVPDMERPLI